MLNLISKFYKSVDFLIDFMSHLQMQRFIRFMSKYVKLLEKISILMMRAWSLHPVSNANMSIRIQSWAPRSDYEKLFFSHNYKD
jgi:hypothetical protein